jgi:hypothetical protein
MQFLPLSCETTNLKFLLLTQNLTEITFMDSDFYKKKFWEMKLQIFQKKGVGTTRHFYLFFKKSFPLEN